MITLKQFLEAAQYRVKEGSDYGWGCYGPNAYTIDTQVGEWNSNSAHIVFDRKTQEVYQASVYDYTNNRAYRIFGNDILRQGHTAEALNRKVDERQAWEDVNYTDLEVEEDFLDKMSAIMNEEEYDTKISVPLNLDRDELYTLMTMAHEKDITLNRMVEIVLEAAIAREKDVV